ncbi:hypothetical protein TRIATDRAFT_300871 [Trichoderma atroviride IMI 206040]|uniref:Uncharacterized protein n=1 Tax=Hypocrea atroviridis (strain ATCC 20476 / IMI 206040) TaxID=452589 RepID=G9P381_HYPAI|nr:uncharacterized protein TRIATDRAFT_300871 [Trichoderma atroviride IMI 206040]EHK42843.1 hypothetical protein TRIATDRAFT_300871 [Trichoderma atroviride IMI 206040]
MYRLPVTYVGLRRLLQRFQPAHFVLNIAFFLSVPGTQNRHPKAACAARLIQAVVACFSLWRLSPLGPICISSESEIRILRIKGLEE